MTTTTTTGTDVKAQLRRWIVDTGTRPDADALTDASDIVGEGFLDSLGLMALISYVEELRERPLEEDELRMENFSCIDRIVEVLFAPPPARGARR